MDQFQFGEIKTGKMLRILGLFVVICAMCGADIPVAPPAPLRVYCGDMPANIITCGSIPQIIPHGIQSRCPGSNKCDVMKCVAKEMGWLDGSSINTAKLGKYLDDFAKEHPDWATAIAQAKSSCLVPKLPAQGYYVDCPAYDVTFCMLATFIRNVPPSQWSSSSDCAYARQYAGACAVCPDDCFAPAIPTGSCNSCRVLPRSP
uniref:Odorant binding protein 14 n=1 Tax=Ostrinia furnacalis TaxID=93504 RepID=A0A1B4ZBJ2_OSTFU|nr:odorant binding protein 14 [Ostrinia furnacalis]